ncbi:hypothetical protein L950_0214500 [Sphingobacterium sp. IITKGP-BTPF85]|nr:cation:dicarboxylase symporter family transporter [Sphingobacterium sp. IITKGP-BTPF85]KKX49683.1 hypothetical protein L950_0214500 [Sphingobacterium sp. IITKGP-BTPF85]
MYKSKMGLITLVSVTIAALIAICYEFSWVNFSPSFLMAVRWIVATVLIVNALVRKNLTTWILTCMILGIFVGLDFPNIAISLQPLSKGFIKLVKTIVGPILFATLVYGIAGHSDLKQVGRMAWKSMLYFFCATTCAILLALGL